MRLEFMYIKNSNIEIEVIFFFITNQFLNDNFVIVQLKICFLLREQNLCATWVLILKRKTERVRRVVRKLNNEQAINWTILTFQMSFADTTRKLMSELSTKKWVTIPRNKSVSLFSICRLELSVKYCVVQTIIVKPIL